MLNNIRQLDEATMMTFKLTWRW